MVPNTIDRRIILISMLATLLVTPVTAQLTDCQDAFGDDVRIVTFEDLAVAPGQAGAVDLVGDEFPLVYLTKGAGADGLFVGIPDPLLPGGNNVNFFAGDFFPVSGAAVFSPDKDPFNSPSPDGILIVDFDKPTDGVGVYFLDAEGFPSRIDAYDGPGGTGNSLGFEIVQNKGDDSQYFGMVQASGIRSVVLTLGGAGDGVGIDDLCFAAPTTHTLCAGQHYDAGTVSVSNDASTMFVEFGTVPRWKLVETHVAAACDAADLPQNKSGNPKIGKFPYSMEHYPWPNSYTVEIDLAQFDDCDPVYIAAHAVVAKTLIQKPYAADAVVSSQQGLRWDGTPVLLARSDDTEALVPDYTGGDITFFSLGFGGEIEVEFACPIANGPGADVGVWEVTNNFYPAETVDVFAKQYELDSWTWIGEATNGRDPAEGSNGLSNTQTQLDLGLVPEAHFIKVVDTTDPGLFVSRPTADSFDLDGVESLWCCVIDETAWGDACLADGTPSGIGFEGGSWATYFTYSID